MMPTTISSLVKKVKSSKNYRFYYFGIPFMTVLVCGSFGLQQFTELRYRTRKTKFLSPEEAAKFGIDLKAAGEISPEEEFKRTQAQIDLDKWENIRGPRPGEDSKAIQDAQRRAMAEANATS